MPIDFTTNNTEILLNPRLDENVRDGVFCSIDKQQFINHIILASSGTTQNSNAFKLIALSKNAILASAKAVNTHLKATGSDVWLNCLPEFHVGGLGIFARAYLTGSKTITLEKWDPHYFARVISSHSITLTSLVPAQIYDLCLHEINAPSSIRGVIVGGGALSQDLWKKALSLNWPLYLSYGLTECASQVATSQVNSQALHLLNHIQAKTTEEGFLMIKSEALLTATLLMSDNKCHVSDPKHNGWLITEDLANLEENILHLQGRSGDFIKIGGESVLFSLLEKKLEDSKLKCSFKHDAALVAYPDDRLGHVIHLVATSKKTGGLVEAFNSSAMPYERIRHVHVAKSIPRTALNKIIKKKLLEMLK